MTTLALVASSLDKFATEIRHLQRTEVREVEEPFGEKQQGSSAMPHKRNPHRSERICGLARLVRGYALTALENVALWHERDISHSSTERVIFPDACLTLDYHPARIYGNYERSGGLPGPDDVQSGVNRWPDFLPASFAKVGGQRYGPTGSL